MSLIEATILNIILLTFPLIIYLIYSLYTRIIDKKNELYLEMAIFSSLYLLLKFGILKYNNLPIVIIDILLIISYLQNKKIDSIILSIIFIIYYSLVFKFNLYFLFIEYILYYLIYLFKKNNFIVYFIIIKSIMFYVYINKLNNSYIILILLFIIMTIIILSIYNKVDDLFKLHTCVESIDKDNKTKESLFKITHEIKNPIAVCKGYLDMFDINNIEHSRKYIPIIKSEINRILYLLQDFLSITKISINKEEMDLNMLLEDTISCLSPLLKSKHINFIFNIKDEEVYINADYNRLKQTFINLIKNSVEAIDSKGFIKLDSKVYKNRVKIIIEDNGIGMNKEELNSIKEAFFTTKSNGTGLGIYMSNEIIKLHNGKLEYYSKKGIGTKVVVTLPI